MVAAVRGAFSALELVISIVLGVLWPLVDACGRRAKVVYRWAHFVVGALIALLGSVALASACSLPAWITLLVVVTFGWSLVLPTDDLVAMRGAMLDNLNQDYVRTARAKGLTERTVVVRHAMRNALIPIATIIAFDIGALIGGAVITETIFAWKGMGSLFVDGLNAGDVNLVMGFFLVTGLLAVVFNLIADLLYSALDPRIRVN